MGVPSKDCFVIGRLLGIRTIANIGLAYIEMGKLLSNKKQLLSYTVHHNDTVHLGDDILLPQWNVTLVGGVLQVNIFFAIYTSKQM